MQNDGDTREKHERGDEHAVRQLEPCVREVEPPDDEREREQHEPPR
jgi:hypothetical protein